MGSVKSIINAFTLTLVLKCDADPVIVAYSGYYTYPTPDHSCYNHACIPDHLLDGDLSTKWNSYGSNGENWVVVGFENAVQLTKFGLYNAGDIKHDVKDFILLYSSYNETGPWTPINQWTASSGVGWQYFDIHASTYSRYYKFYEMSTHGGLSGCYIKEIDFEYETRQPTLQPTAPLPTINPSSAPTSLPSKQPTINPSSSPTQNLYDIRYKNGMHCHDLSNRIALEYAISHEQCIHNCQQRGTECRMINYFDFFKTRNDSRCYLFNDVCMIKVDETKRNQSVVAYKTHRSECSNYPLDWIDLIGDSCDFYETFNWCDNGVLLRNENEYDNLRDTTYGLTATQTCCECGGGVDTVDDVVLSYDNNWMIFNDDVICVWVERNLTPLLGPENILRNWDTIMLYDFCDHLDEVDCEYLINTDFAAMNYDYTLHLCDGYQFNSNETHFVFDVILNDMNHDTYINEVWFDLDLSYYSVDITIKHAQYSQCIQQITTAETTNQTYRYGVHPCYVLDTIHPTVYPTMTPSASPSMDPSLHPTVYPSTYPTMNPSTYPSIDPSLHPTGYPSSFPLFDATIKATDHSVWVSVEPTIKSENTLQSGSSSMVIIVTLICALGLSLCVIVLLTWILFKKNKQNNEISENATNKAVEGRIYPELHDGESNELRSPSAPTLHNDHQDVDCQNPVYSHQ
eukprot:797554_1